MQSVDFLLLTSYPIGIILGAGRPGGVSRQHSMKNRRAVLCAIKIEGKNRGEEGTTPVTTACLEAGK